MILKIYLVKPDLMYFEQYNEMMEEWINSNTQIAPWFLEKPFQTIAEFAQFIRMLNDIEHGIVDKKFASSTSYFAIDENDNLIGAGSLRHYLTEDGLHSWGHTGYGVRPSERKKGYATQIEKCLLEEAKKRHIRRVLVGVHESNTGSIRVIEKCGGRLENIVSFEEDPILIRRYWIDNR